MNKKEVITSIIIAIMLISLIGIAIYLIIIEPSLASYYSQCEKDNKLLERYHTVGQTTVTVYSNGSKEIDVEVEDNLGPILEKQVQKHEWVHVNQIKKGYIASCNKKLDFILLEIEAYTMELLPNKVFYHFYPKEELASSNNSSETIGSKLAFDVMLLNSTIPQYTLLRMRL